MISSYKLVVNHASHSIQGIKPFRGIRNIFALSTPIDCNYKRNDPISKEEFNKFMNTCLSQNKNKNNKYLIAVSGGPDSTALCYLVSQWIPNKKQIVALTVDHKLREESTFEATSVHLWLQSLGIEHIIETIHWSNIPDANKLELEARENRYNLIEKICKEKHITNIIVAHHADDQIETFLMRFYRNSGIHGLTGMESIYSKSKNLTILRPFLSIRKSRLIATCNYNNIPFFTDPSNSDLHYDRNRVRHGIALLEEKQQLNIEQLYHMQQYISDIDNYIITERNLCIQNIAKCNLMFGYYILDLSLLCTYPKYIANRVIGTLLQSVCNAPYPPRNSILAPIINTIYNNNGIINRGFTCLNSILTPLSKDHSKAIICTSYSSQRYIENNLYVPKPISMFSSLVFDNRLTLSLSLNSKNYEHPHKRHVIGWEPLNIDIEKSQFYCRCLKENERSEIRSSFPRLCNKKGINDSLFATLPVITTYIQNKETIVLVPALGISRLNSIQLKLLFNKSNDIPHLPMV